MLRIIIAAILIYAVWSFWKRASRTNRARRAEASLKAPAEMVACRRCGTFVLRTDSVIRGGECFCSAECAAGNDS